MATLTCHKKAPNGRLQMISKAMLITRPSIPLHSMSAATEASKSIKLAESNPQWTALHSYQPAILPKSAAHRERLSSGYGPLAALWMKYICSLYVLPVSLSRSSGGVNVNNSEDSAVRPGPQTTTPSYPPPHPQHRESWHIYTATTRPRPISDSRLRQVPKHPVSLP
jgi:hypothetical protein